MRTANHGRGRRLRRYSPGTPGSSPGRLDLPPGAPPPQVHLMAWGPDAFEERQDVELHTLPALLLRFPVVWLDVSGLGDADVLRALGQLFTLHPLALEDVVHVGQRGKAEEYDEQLFVVLHIPNDEHPAGSEQVSLFLGKNYVVTFQEFPGDCFEPVRERIRTETGRLRRSGADYLAYALLDAVVDSYFPRAEALAAQLVAIEKEIVETPSSELAIRLHRLRGELVHAWQAVLPLKELIQGLRRQSPGEKRFITPTTAIFLRDCQDHAAHLVELIDGYRQMASDLMHLLLAQLNNRMSEVMKVLTVIATLFIPLTFIAGIYGMNFDRAASPWNMPELGWWYGYPFALGMMAVVAGGLVVYFWRKGWMR